MESLKKYLRSQHQHVEPSPHRAVAQGIRKVSLSHAHGSADDDVLMPVGKAETEEVFHFLPVDGNRRLPVEPLKGLLLIQKGASHLPEYPSLLAPLDLVVEYQLKELPVRELLGFRIGSSLWQGHEDAREPELLQCLFQFRGDLHLIPPFSQSRSPVAQSARAMVPVFSLLLLH